MDIVLLLYQGFMTAAVMALLIKSFGLYGVVICCAWTLSVVVSMAYYYYKMTQAAANYLKNLAPEDRGPQGPPTDILH